MADQAGAGEHPMDLLVRAADEGRNVQPEGEEWTDDQAHAVEVFAMRVSAALMPLMDELHEFRSGIR